jgi:hypothetical protein
MSSYEVHRRHERAQATWQLCITAIEKKTGTEEFLLLYASRLP